jgi:drug/metabolite transporter (DMT)-like permease
MFKSLGASVPMLVLAALTGARFPHVSEALIILIIGSIGYGLSIWLDLLALRDLGAAREAVIFATAHFVGAGFAVVALGESLSVNLIGAGALMMAGLALLLKEDHAHWHRHEAVCHEHKHLHTSDGQDPHHVHPHPHLSDEHHRHTH